MALCGGQAVIVDAVQAKQEEREALAALAAELGVPFTGLWLEAPANCMRERVAARIGDVSDATPRWSTSNLAMTSGRTEFRGHRCEPPVDQVAAACLERIGVKPERPRKFILC